MTWTGQSFSVGQVLTAAQMTNLQADITAAMAGDTGAPRLVNAGVDAAAAIAGSKLNLTASIVRGDLSTGTSSASDPSISSSFNFVVTLTAYSFFPMIYADDELMYMCGHSTDGGSADAPRFEMDNVSGGSVSAVCDWRYIAA